jgi:hypothetical protein
MCGFLSIFWMGMAAGGSYPYWEGWPTSFGWIDWLISALLVGPLPVFLGLAVVFWIAEKPRTILVELPSGDHDLRKLY